MTRRAWVVLQLLSLALVMLVVMVFGADFLSLPLWAKYAIALPVVALELWLGWRATRT